VVGNESPSPPPPPPIISTIEVSVTAAGAASDFAAGTPQRTSVMNHFADRAQVPVSSVALTVADVNGANAVVQASTTGAVLDHTHSAASAVHRTQASASVELTFVVVTGDEATTAAVQSQVATLSTDAQTVSAALGK